MGSMTCRPPSPHASMGACQKLDMPVHADVKPWLGYLGKSSNKTLVGAGHGLGVGHVTKTSLSREGLMTSLSCWWCMAQTARHVDVLQDFGKKLVR